MSPSTNNGAFGWEDDREPSSHYTSTSRQQHTPITGNSHWTGGPHRESYVPTGLAFTTRSWPSVAFLDPPSMYGGGMWPSDQHLDEVRLGPLSSAPGGNADGPGMNLLVGTGAAATPVLEPAFPVVQGASSVSQLYPPPPPPLNWTQAPGPPWRPTSWNHPVASQHGIHSGPITSLATSSQVPRAQLATPSVITGNSERRVTPASRLPSSAAPPSVFRLTHNDPVPVSPPTSQSRGEPLDLSMDTTAFQCHWTSGGTRCTALIAGNRRSVTSHLRDEHDLTSDGQKITCAWGRCTASMQRRNIARHIVTCHFEVKVTCSQCGMALSRTDANKKHQLACTGIAKTPTVVEAAEEDDERLFF